MAATLCCINHPTRRQTETSSHSSDSTHGTSLPGTFSEQTIKPCAHHVPMTIPDRIGTEEKAMDYNDLKKNGLIRALDHNPDTKKPLTR